MPARRIPLERPPTKADEVRVKHQQAVWRTRIGANLGEAGTETGLSQRQLATRANVSANYLGQAELGRRVYAPASYTHRDALASSIKVAPSRVAGRSCPSQCAPAWVGGRDGEGCGAEEVGCGSPDAETWRALAALPRHVARLRRRGPSVRPAASELGTDCQGLRRSRRTGRQRQAGDGGDRPPDLAKGLPGQGPRSPGDQAGTRGKAGRVTHGPSPASGTASTPDAESAAGSRTARRDRTREAGEATVWPSPRTRAHPTQPIIGSPGRWHYRRKTNPPRWSA